MKIVFNQIILYLSIFIYLILEKNKLMHIATTIFNSIGTKSDLQNLVFEDENDDEQEQMVLISPNFPIKMTLTLKHTVIGMLKVLNKEGKRLKSTTAVLRVMLHSLIPDAMDFAHKNSITLQEHH